MSVITASPKAGYGPGWVLHGARHMVGRAGIYLLLVLTSLITVFPFLVCLITSFAPNRDVNSWPPRFIPSSFTLDNYVELFARIPVGRQFLNSVIFATSVMVLSGLLHG